MKSEEEVREASALYDSLSEVITDPTAKTRYFAAAVALQWAIDGNLPNVKLVQEQLDYLKGKCKERMSLATYKRVIENFGKLK